MIWINLNILNGLRICPETMLGKLRSTVIDCRDPRELATFYAGVLGGSVHDEDDLFRVYRDPAGHPFCLVLGSRRLAKVTKG